MERELRSTAITQSIHTSPLMNSRVSIGVEAIFFYQRYYAGLGIIYIVRMCRRSCYRIATCKSAKKKDRVQMFVPTDPLF
jgi:hypothetical protein